MASLEEAAHSLQFENSQLRTELKAQQTVNMKLRRERDDILLTLHDCKEENRYMFTHYYSTFTSTIPLAVTEFLMRCIVFIIDGVACRRLYEELKLRDQMFQEYREKMEGKIAELTAIKGDLELRLQRCGEDGEQVNGSCHIVGTSVIFLTKKDNKINSLLTSLYVFRRSW